MKRNLLWGLLSLLGLLAPAARAQTATTLARETFEGLSTDYGYSANSFNSPATTTPFSPLSYFERTPLSSSGAAYPGTTQPLTNQQGSYAFTGENVRGFGTTVVRSAGYVQLNPISAAGYQNLRLTVALAAPRGGAFAGAGANGVRATDRIRLQYSFDGGPFVTAGLLLSSEPVNGGDFQQDTSSPLDSIPDGLVLGQAFQDISANIAGTGTSLRVRVVADTRTPELAFDDIRVTGVLSNTPTPTPTLSGLATTAATYTEGGSPVPLASSLTVGYSNGSATLLTGGTVRISSNFAAQDQLNFTNQNGITGSYSTGTGVLTLSGTASQAAYQAALRSVTYSNTNTTTLSTGTRQLTFQVRSGTAVSNSPVRALTITGTLNAAAALNYTENFDTDGDGTRYFGNTWADASGGRVGSFRATTSPATYGGTQIGDATFTGYSGGYWFGEGTVSTANPTTPYGLVQLAPVNAAGRSNLRFTVALGAAGNWLGYFNAANPGDRFELFYSTDGGTTLTLFGAFYGVDGNTPARQDADLDPLTPAAGALLSPALRDFTFELPAAAAVSNLTFVLRQRARAQSEIAYDNIRITAAAPPTVATGTVGSLTGSTASISGNTLATDGGATLSDYGVVYVAGTGIPTTANSKVPVGTTSPASFPATFAASLTGLAAGTQYTARAYATNSVGTSYGASVTFTTPTTVVAIVRVDPDPTNASQVRFTVSFAAPVAGLTSSNFSLATTGTLSGVSVSSVSGAGTTYTVAVNTGTGSGSLRLGLANSTGLSPGVSNVPFTTSESYAIDKVAPTVAIGSGAGSAGSTTATAPLPFTVTFSESVAGFEASDVAVTNGSLTGFAGAGAAYSFSVTPAAAGPVTVTVPANAATDQASNGNAAATPFSITYQPPVAPTTAAPVLTSPANPTTTGSPTFSGTAPTGSTVTVYLAANGGAAQAIGTTTAAGGTFSFTPATALAVGQYTAYATAQVSGQAASANSNALTFTVAAPGPTVTNLSPASGPVGTRVTITGTNLGGTTVVSFNGTPASSFVVNSATSLTAVVATGTSTGLVSVLTPTGTATSATPFTVTPPVALALVSATPARNALAAAPATSVALTYNQDVDPATTGGVRVFSHQAGGRKAATASTNGSTLVLAPATTFKPGETVFVTSPASVRSTTSGSLAGVPTVYQFTTAAAAATGTFGGGTTVAAGQLPASVALADVNGDGDLDVLTTNGTRAGTVNIRLNQGQGSFSGTGSVSVGAYPAHLVAADVDGDGDLDLLVANAGANSVSVRFNNGLGSFSGTGTVAVGSYPISVTAADLDADGDLDLVAANLGSNNASVRFNDGQGNFSGTASVLVGPNTSSVEAADVDNDGDLDLLLANAGRTGTVSICLNNGLGVFSGTQRVAVGSYPAHVTAADLNADGNLDLLTANATDPGTVSIALGDGHGRFAVSATLAVGRRPASVEAADVDGDGDLDVLTANAAGNTVSVRLNNGLGSFSGNQEVAVGCAPLRVATADLDSDGDLDLATADAGGGSVSVRFNQQLPTAQPSVARAGGLATTAAVTIAPPSSPLYPLVDGTLFPQFLTAGPRAATDAEPTVVGAELNAYPNPVIRTTTVRLATVQTGLVQVRVYNALGQVVTTLYQGPLAAGQLLECPFDATGLAAGVYTCRLTGAGFTRSLKLVVNP